MSSIRTGNSRRTSGRRGNVRHAVTRRQLLRASGAAMIGGAALALTGCAPGLDTAGRAVEATADQLAERYVRLALQLAKHQPSLVETWMGPPAWAEGVRVPVATLRVEAGALVADIDTRLGQHIARTAPPRDVREDLRDIDEAPGSLALGRLRYLHGQIAALEAAAGRLLGESQSFADEAVTTLGHAAPARDGAALDAIRQRLSDALPGRGTLAERHAAFRRSMAVPPDRIESVFAAAVAWCRDATRDLFPLPAGESLTTRVADEAGWEAFSRPAGPRASDLWVARRSSADAAHLLQLAAHEGTPGHHAQHVLATAMLVEGRGWTERALTPAFGPHRLVAEGAAEAGADLLLPLATREQVCREVLLPAAGQSPAAAARLVAVERLVADLGMEVAYIASEYLDSSLSTAVVAARLRDDALVLDPNGLVAFIEKQRVKVLAYPLGRALVWEALGTVPSPARWTRFRHISTTLRLEPPAPGARSA